MTTEQLSAERLLTMEEAAGVAGCTTEAMRCRVKRYDIPTQRPVAPARRPVKHLKQQSVQ